MHALPTAERNGKVFAIAGRTGEWRYADGRRKPSPTFRPSSTRCLAVSTTEKGKRLVREFVRYRRYLKTTDQLALDRMAEGSLRVEPTGEVYTRLASGGRMNGHWNRLTQYSDKNGYLFVRLYRHGKRKAFAVNRLVIMAHTGELIPEGYDVDHRDRDRANNERSNLRLRTMHDNRRDQQHAELPF